MKILVIGESCTDEFNYGECKRLSPEAPVPIMNFLEIVENGGMAANVVRNLKVLNSEVDITLWTQPELIRKVRYVEKKSNHMFLRMDYEGPITPLTLSLEKKDYISYFDFVIVSDYNKGLLSDELIKQIGFKSKLSILDSKRKLTKEIVESFTFVKLNELEHENNKDLNDVYNIITTLGSKGCKYNNKIYSSPNPQETIDVSGAGDTFTSAFIMKYFETKDINQAITFANQVSAIVVNKRGVATP
jgi:D-beta-D-heptose 7-phosphate kinase/D-beta-D-heptose 1-phosphate adenosyltransferase